MRCGSPCSASGQITCREANRYLCANPGTSNRGLGLADVMFAVDSVPAIFGITQEPCLVLMANAFALMGLRQLYFLFGGLLNRLVYLDAGLAVVLGFIGVTLVLPSTSAAPRPGAAPPSA